MSDNLRGAGILRGVVKWFNDAKGFGFIEHETGKDVFVHYSVIESDGFKTLKDGEQVEYELKEGAKGLHAARVARVNAPVKEKKVADHSGEPLAGQLEIEANDVGLDSVAIPLTPGAGIVEDIAAGGSDE